MTDFTTILERAQAGDAAAAQELLPLVYEELRRIANHRMASEAPGQTLQATALVHEAWLRLGGAEQPSWQNRAHFFAAAGEAMRRILIDRARKRRVRESSGLAHPEELHESQLAFQSPSDQVLAIHEALDDLAAIDATAAQLVKLRYFVGMTLPEAAEALGVALRSAERLWTFSRAWLRDRLRPGSG